MSNISNKDDLRFFFFHGKGSSGKDTQAGYVTEGNKSAVVISTGELVRAAKKYSHRHHEILTPHLDTMRNGGLVPDEAIIRVAMREMEMERARGMTDFVFTGFPRTITQLNEVDEIVEEMKQNVRLDVTHVYFAVHDSTARRRAKNRRDEHIANDFEVRRDDEPEVVENRLRVFRESTQPMIHALLDEGRLHVVKAGRGIEEVNELLELKLRGARPENGLVRAIPLEPVRHESTLPLRARR